ncbi:hypothetical protein GCM10028805_45980 [Spirosoma harenae]
MTDFNLMFADWYREAELNPTSYTIDERKKAIVSILQNNKISFWLDVLKIYLGFKVSDIPSYIEFCNEFKKQDSSFPLQENEHLIHVLAACTLGAKLDLISETSDALALAILTSNFLGQFSIQSKIPIFDKAKIYIKKESVRFREVEDEELIDSDEIEFDSISIISKEDTLEDSDFKKPIGDLNEVIQLLVSQVNTITKEIVNHQKINKNLLEEVNILWWVFGESSNLFEKRFKEVGILPMIFVAPFEISEFIEQSPGHLATNVIIDKVLKLAQNKDKAYPNVSLLEVVNSLPENIRKHIDIKDFDELLVFTPSLLGIKKSLQVEEGENWDSIYKKSSLGADSKKKLGSLELSEQIYRELQFFNSYRTCL